MEIKYGLDEYYDSEISSGRLYPVLDDLADTELVDKSRAQHDKQINAYELTNKGEQFGERTTSGAINGAYEFTIEMIDNLERAIGHPDMTSALAEILSTEQVVLRYEIETSIDVGDD